MTTKRSDDRTNRIVNPRADEMETPGEASAAPTAEPEVPEVDPPRTTTGGWFTAPKFGSAGSGGAELEPGPKRE